MKSSQLYSEVQVNSEVLGASSYRMVQMLMEKCVKQIKEAKKAIANKNIRQKHKAITNASDIVSYLRMCLNFRDERTHAIADQLNSLYEFMVKNLLQATLHDDEIYLDQAETVLQNIKEGWDGIAESK